MIDATPAAAGRKPVVMQMFPLLHPDGLELLEPAVDLRTVSALDVDTIVREAPDAVAIIGRGPGRVGAEVYDALPRLEILSASGSGADCFDLEAATERRLPVLHNPGVAPNPVAEYVVATTLMMLKKLPYAAHELAGGAEWNPRTRFYGREAAGTTIGLVGFGNIARLVADKCGRGLGMRVLAFDPAVSDEVFASHDVQRVETLAEVLSVPEVVSIHVPLLPETRKLIGRDELARMRPDAILINTSRGGVVDEDALVGILRNERIAGAAVDVFAREPTTGADPLVALPNVFATPHMAGVTHEAMRNLTLAMARNTIAAIAGDRPPHLVNPEVWADRRRAVMTEVTA